MDRYCVERIGPGSYWVVETETGTRKMGPFASPARAQEMCEHRNNPPAEDPRTTAERALIRRIANRHPARFSR